MGIRRQYRRVRISHVADNVSKWNYEHKALLLQAELHYLNGELESADASYKAAIKSANEHKIINHEAMACELYGIFCVENGKIEQGGKSLLQALEKYTIWGAIRKVKELTPFVDMVCYGAV